MKQKLLKFSRVLLTLVMVFSVCSKLLAQNNTIRGIVLDNNGEPLPGVTIMVKGTTRATVTGVEGRFTFAAEKGETLVLSTIGFQSGDNCQFRNLLLYTVKTGNKKS
jgi:hypothetical protein